MVPWLPGEGLWLPEFTSWLQMVMITGCFDRLPLLWLWYRDSLVKVPGCLDHFLVASI